MSVSAKTTVFLSATTMVYVVFQFMPFNIGEPIYVFFGVLFASYIGSISYVCVYVLTTLNIIKSIIPLIEYAAFFKQVALSFSADAATAAVINATPDYIYVIGMIGLVYASITTSIVACRMLIKKLHLDKRLGYVHA